MLTFNPLHMSPKVMIISLALTLAVFLTACSNNVQENTGLSEPTPSKEIRFTSADRAKIRHFSQFDKLKSKRYKSDDYRFKTNDRLPRFYPRLPLPPHLERKLSPLPPSYIRIQIGDDYGIINIYSRVIYDIVYNVDY